MAVYAVSRPRVLKDAGITRLRAFPSAGSASVSAGSVVGRDSVLGEYSSRQRRRLVRVESSGGRISATVLVAVGQKVKRGEVLAYYSYMFGLGYTEYASPCDGEVEAVSQATGHIVVREADVALACHLPGSVERVDEAVGVWVRSRGDMAEAAAGAGYARSGTLVKKADSGSSSAASQSVGPEDAGKAVLAGAFVSQEFIEACLRYRVAGIVAASAPYRVFHWYRDLAASLDWDEFLARYWARELRSKDAAAPRPSEIVPALVLTEGFGEISMPDEVFALLASHEGDEVFVDGAGALDADLADYLDAGPCVIAPKSGPCRGAGPCLETAGGRGGFVGPGSLKEIAPGDRVRVIRLSEPSVEGIVGSEPEENIVLPNGLSVPGVSVVTDKGETLMAPVFNIQVTGS